MASSDLKLSRCDPKHLRKLLGLFVSEFGLQRLERALAGVPGVSRCSLNNLTPLQPRKSQEGESMAVD